jgi:hypothetical protein
MALSLESPSLRSIRRIRGSCGYSISVSSCNHKREGRTSMAEPAT